MFKSPYRTDIIAFVLFDLLFASVLVMTQVTEATGANLPLGGPQRNDHRGGSK